MDFTLNNHGFYTKQSWICTTQAQNFTLSRIGRCDFLFEHDDFCVKNDDFVLKMMGSALKLMIFDRFFLFFRALEKVNTTDLWQMGWIDKQTKAIFHDFTLYVERCCLLCIYMPAIDRPLYAVCFVYTCRRLIDLSRMIAGILRRRTSSHSAASPQSSRATPLCFR